jgi:hypothetical protein
MVYCSGCNHWGVGCGQGVEWDGLLFCSRECLEKYREVRDSETTAGE